MAGNTVYAIASGKGGVGKTTTTVNLGTALAGAGHRTVIVDCDLAMANLARFVSLGTDVETLHDVLADEADVEDATYRLADGIAAVPSPADLARYSDLATEKLSEAVATLRSVFDYVLLDVGAGVGRETIVPLKLADATLLVVTPEPAAVQDAEKTVGLVDRAGSNVRGVVVTRVRDDDEAAPPAIAKRLGQPLVATIPEDPTVRESVRAGRPVVIHDSDCPAATAYGRLAATVIGWDGDDDTASDGGSDQSRDEGSPAADGDGGPVDEAGESGDQGADEGSILADDEDEGSILADDEDGRADDESDTTGASHSEISEALAEVKDDDQ